MSSPQQVLVVAVVVAVEGILIAARSAGRQAASEATNYL